jgi:hypothetical protein
MPLETVRENLIDAKYTMHALFADLLHSFDQAQSKNNNFLKLKRNFKNKIA